MKQVAPNYLENVKIFCQNVKRTPNINEKYVTYCLYCRIIIVRWEPILATHEHDPTNKTDSIVAL